MSRAAPRHIAVVDIGKSNAKVALVDLETSLELAARRQPNRPRTDGPYPHHDVDAIWAFIVDSLAALRREHPVDAICVTTHGATAALVDATGDLALPVLDYEFSGPDGPREAYEKLRPPFADTGTPPLPAGLNLGAQLFWQQQTFPDRFAATSVILAYPQYWALKLCGIAASEVTSLGCHTDLWRPYARDFSSLVAALGWRKLFPPLRKASDTLGPLLPELAARTGIDPATPVLCGIHDSNASLLPHLLTRKPPFAVVSTGTWVVAMAIGAHDKPLDPARDTLVNVDAFGNPVPSARFMGGREYETAMAGQAAEWSDEDVDAVLSQGCVLLPAVQPGSGPYPALRGGWAGPVPKGGQRFVATSFYLALMTATCLDLIGACGDIVVEGPFGGNGPYLSMLSHAAGRPVVTTGNGVTTGTSIGAALLAGRRPAPLPMAATAVDRAPIFKQYAAQWRTRLPRAAGA